ncbi:FAD-binding oxidoreductase [Humibacillus xanthopallidus]|uniref:Alkyldihydroxyacetonephosphate synthase n=1 Tax=Humibacillus xanthopallidus TaxID=412689 RepID=A0A543I2D5_9MICO|nr:FAD-binding oxidoreductase [Humibacillus xanthopallidus]TQM64717.1 alkyldihydroxyacetonephosphate synthase [Humibacillus xanthopallidus]
MDELTRSIPRSVWYGWGDPAEAPPLSAGAWSALASWGVARGPQTPPVALEAVELPPIALGDKEVAALREVVGSDHVHTDRRSRVEHAGGKSYPDLWRLRHGDGSEAPDVIVEPADAAEVQRLLEVCAERRIAVVPFGGGTSVVGGVGGVEARGGAVEGGDTGEQRCAGVVAVDLRRLDQLLHVDPVARLATFQPGLRGPDIERALEPHGLTLGHFPQSHQEATLGGYVATRSAGQASTGYGRIDDNVLGVRLATPRGELVLGGRSPASAAGPRLLDLVVGSEGALGIITEATLRVAPRPAAKRYAAWLLPSFHAGSEALRGLAQEVGPGLLPDVCRLSDEEETRVNLALAGRSGAVLRRYGRVRGLEEPALVVLVWEGTDSAALKHRQSVCERVLGRDGGRRLPARVARAWEKGRFAGPYLRDELMGRRILVDTLETATTWDRLGPLHAAVGSAIRSSLADGGRGVVVMCHVSHVYATGASLYFTFVAGESADPLAQWRAVKSAATEAIVAGGGTITHHHGVGVDHAPWLGAEIGDLGLDVLRAIKTELDPTGILNPGKLIPRR